MQEQKVLWLDVDGVLLDYTRAFLDYSRHAMLPNKNNTTYESLDDYDLTKLFETPDACFEIMKNFSYSPEFANLETHVARTHLEVLRNSGYDLRIITQLSAGGVARKNRIMNLTNAFGPIFSEVVFTEHGQCKLDYLWQRWLKETGPAYYGLIEDNPKLLEKANIPDEAGFVDTIAIVHPYNVERVEKLSLPKFPSFFGAYHYLLERVI